MQHPSDAPRILRHPERRPPDIDAAPGFTAETPRSVCRIDLPHGVIGGRSNNTDTVTVLYEPRGHLARVLADPRLFGREIHAAYQNLQIVFPCCWAGHDPMRRDMHPISKKRTIVPRTCVLISKWSNSPHYRNICHISALNCRTSNCLY